MDINEIKRIADMCKETVEERIHYSDELDDCTQCFRQGMEDALEAIQYLLDAIDAEHKRTKQEEIFTSVIIVPDGQMPLFKD